MCFLKRMFVFTAHSEISSTVEPQQASTPPGPSPQLPSCSYDAPLSPPPSQPPQYHGDQQIQYWATIQTGADFSPQYQLSVPIAGGEGTVGGAPLPTYCDPMETGGLDWRNLHHDHQDDGGHQQQLLPPADQQDYYWHGQEGTLVGVDLHQEQFTEL